MTQGAVSYESFAQEHPAADKLIRRLSAELGRHGQCGTLNPAIGYVLRQAGLQSILVTGEIACSQSPILKKIKQEYHLWLIVGNGQSVWHVDAANPFLLDIWYNKSLPKQEWEEVATGKRPGPPVPIVSSNFIWGTPPSYGISITPGTLSAKAPFFDALEDVGKKDRVRELFRSHGFDDPYGFTRGVLDLKQVSTPVIKRT